MCLFRERTFLEAPSVEKVEGVASAAGQEAARAGPRRRRPRTRRTRCGRSTSSRRVCSDLTPSTQRKRSKR